MSYSTSGLSRKSGDINGEAMRRPVTLTQRDKPRLVLTAIEDQPARALGGEPKASEPI